MMRVTVLLLDGGLASTAVGPMEIFQSAGTLWNALHGEPPQPKFEVHTAAPRNRPVRPDGPLTLRPAHRLEDVGDTDLVFVPAIGMDVVGAVRRYRGVVAWLRERHARGTLVAGVCSGVALLAESGILDGRRATTHWALAEAYAARYPRVRWRPEYFVTEQDRVYCGGGVNAALDLSLYLVERLCGREEARRCAKALLVEMPRTWQAGFAHLPNATHHSDAAVREAQEWLHEHFSGEVRLEALAAHLGMSPRNFVRRFKEATGRTPLSYLQALRVDAAKKLLEDGVGSVQEVCGAVGYEDPVFFRNLFRRHTGVAPAEYRRRFAGASRAAAP